MKTPFSKGKKEKLNQSKDNIQQDAIRKWINASYTGTLSICTGGGKTRVAVIGVGELLRNDEETLNALVVVPTINLKDQWTDEFIKWGYSDVLNKVTIECVQSSYKDHDRHFDVLVLDEVHLYLSDEFKKVFDISYKYLLALTATIPSEPDRQSFLFGKAPLLYSLNLTEAVELGIVSSYDLYNMSITLTAKESRSYQYWDKRFKEAQHELNKHIFVTKLEYTNSFKIAQLAKEDRDHPMYKIAKDFWLGMSMRKYICYTAERKIQTTLDIIKKYPERKWIIFTQHIKFADRINFELQESDIPSVVYHSGLKKQEKETALAAIKSPHIRVIVSAMALNTGFDLSDIDSGICVSGNSTDITNIQQMGRSLRMKENKKALYINLYSFGTQEEIWTQKKNVSLKPIWISKLSDIVDPNQLTLNLDHESKNQIHTQRNNNPNNTI